MNEPRFAFDVVIDPDGWDDDQHRVVCTVCGWTSNIRPNIPEALYSGNKHYERTHHG